MSEPLHFNPHELEEMKRWAALEPGQRIGAMLLAQEFALGLIRGSLMEEHPELSMQEINLLLIAEVERRKGSSNG
jgi:hypothetical protein